VSGSPKNKQTRNLVETNLNAPLQGQVSRNRSRVIVFKDKRGDFDPKIFFEVSIEPEKCAKA